MEFRRMAARGVLCLTAVAAVGAAWLRGPAASAAGGAAQGGYDVTSLDRTCKPCDNFYQFASGGWIKNNPIPPDQSAWSRGSINREAIQVQLREILEAAGKANAPMGSNEQKIGDFYASCMDTAAIENAGVKPLEAEFAAIAAIQDANGLVERVARLQSQGVQAMFTFGSDQDFKNSARVIGEANQGGLGLPDRDYYTRDDEKSVKLREQYVAHVTKMLELAGDSPEKAAAEAKAVMAIETALAKASMTNVELRDPSAIYHMMSIADVQAATPNISWAGYLATTGSKNLAELNVGQPEFFKALNAMLKSVPLDDWKAYLRWHVLDAAASSLSDAFVQENFAFGGRILTGAKELRVRWKRCVSATDGTLGEALGKAYVEKHFPPEAKAHALEMVRNLLAALRADIPTVDWMGPETKKAAIAKLDAFTVKIGYPDKWRDYSKLRIERTGYLANVVRGQEFARARDLSKIGQPVDKTEWGLTPPTINAYYNPQNNEIVFPAAILQPPFFDPEQDDAYNYGGVGSVIGHEITHGFDDEGAQFDPQGNLTNWWTAQDLKNFRERGECIVKQFDAYKFEGDLHMNGKLVEGESIADLGGLKIAFAAYEKTLQGKPRVTDANGFTPEQRFFLGFARMWQKVERPEFARLLANVDPHPLARFRAIAAPSNMTEFAQAWGCKKGDGMVRESACRIW